MQNTHAEVLIIGAGIIGLTLARELVERGCDNIVLIEKEDHIGAHASGRNSGVLHAGIYYEPGTAKARSCLQGNRMMKEYCRSRGIDVLENGKVIVTRTHEELPVLDDLHRRAASGGAEIRFIGQDELARMEPSAVTVEKALYSAETAVVDPKKVLAALQKDLEATGRVTIKFNTLFHQVIGNTTAKTSSGDITFDRIVNAAGAHSDRVAHRMNAGSRYVFIPFKGIYRKLKTENACPVNGSIYPVPDIRNPFLGVHFTKSVYGEVYLGPTAIPAFGREHYGLLRGVDGEALRILYEDAVMFFANPKFRRIALKEPRKYIPWFFWRDARKLVRQLPMKHVVASDKSGIRAQLVDWQTKELVMDFLVEKDGNATHVLNAISPAFTSSMAFAKILADEYM